MSRYNKYAKKVDEIAKAAFEEYRAVEASYEKAKEQAKQFPQRHGAVDAQYAAQSTRARADFLEAKEALTAAKRALQSHNNEIAALRKELAAELDDHYSADPAALDSSMLELLKSGILKPSEYTKLMNAATESDNPTMVRMVAKYAGDAAAEVSKRYGDDSEQARTLRAISYAANQNNGNDVLGAFDVMAEAFRRTSNNPAMMGAWGELTAETVENF